MSNLLESPYGRSISVNHNCSSGYDDGGSESSLQTRGQEKSVGSAGSSRAIPERSQRDRVWDEVEYLLSSLSSIKKQIASGTDWDPCEVDWLKERYNLCKKQALHYILCLNLSEVLQSVSFPGEHLTYLQIAERIIKGCPKSELYLAIKEIGLNPGGQVYFKARTDLVPLERAEQILLTMIGDAEFILAKNFNEKLNIPTNSASYKNLKKVLSESGWQWTTRRLEGKPCKVIAKRNRTFCEE